VLRADRVEGVWMKPMRIGESEHGFDKGDLLSLCCVLREIEVESEKEVI